MVEDGGEELTQEQKQQFLLLLFANADLFAESANPGHTSLINIMFTLETGHLFTSQSAVSLYTHERK